MRVEFTYGLAGVVGSLASGHLFHLYSSSLGHGTILLIISTLLHLLCLLHSIFLLQVSVCMWEGSEGAGVQCSHVFFLCISNQIVYFYSWTLLEQLCMIHSIFYNGPSSTLLLAPPPLKVSFFWLAAPSKQKGSEHQVEITTFRGSDPTDIIQSQK